MMAFLTVKMTNQPTSEYYGDCDYDGESMDQKMET